MTHLSNNYLFYLTPIAAGIAFLISLIIFLRQPAEKSLRYFSIFLLVNCLMETFLNMWAMHGRNTLFTNNIWTVLVVSFDIWLLREIVYRRNAKKIFLFTLIAYPLCALVNIFFIQTGGFHTMTYCLGCLLIVVACVYYFWELFQLKHSVDLLRLPYFWICSGLLFFYSCTFPLYGLTQMMESLPKVILENLFAIFVFLNIFLYLSFTIAFLCRLKTRKSMS